MIVSSNFSFFIPFMKIPCMCALSTFCKSWVFPFSWSYMTHLSFSGWWQVCPLWGWSAGRCAPYPGQSDGADTPLMDRCRSTHSELKGSEVRPAVAGRKRLFSLDSDLEIQGAHKNDWVTLSNRTKVAYIIYKPCVVKYEMNCIYLLF